MKSFLFKNVWLLSRKDRRARLISFHPRKNLIVGLNHTGKSSLIKSLFQTLGAKPKGELQQWDENTISAVEFSFDGVPYRAIHQRNNRALFDGTGQLIVATNSHEHWTEVFAKTVFFNLVITDKRSETVPADPRCFFLPFYINQDGSWGAEWDTFLGLQQYRAPMAPILEFFSGVKPPEFYEVHSERAQHQKALDDLQREQRFLERARERFGKALSLSGPKVDPENFEQDIARLTAEVTGLNDQQEKLRDTAVRERELAASIKMQVRLGEATLETYDRDATYLRTEPRDVLTCPTCGAEHQEPFLDLLLYAEDARVLRELVSQLNDDARKAVFQHRKTQTAIRELSAQYERVSGILSVRRGNLALQDVVDGMGAESAFKAFEVESATLAAEIDEKVIAIRRLSERLKELTDAGRAKEILNDFRSSYAAALHSLKVPQMNTTNARLTNRPNLSGSGGPRSILAYYGALWHACLNPKNGSFAVPLVIDAPNQQGQDKLNLPAVLHFLGSQLPAAAQVIVGSEIDTEDFFEQRIVLEDAYKLLREDEYESVDAVVEPLITNMYRAIQQEDNTLFE